MPGHRGRLCHLFPLSPQDHFPNQKVRLATVIVHANDKFILADPEIYFLGKRQHILTSLPTITYTTLSLTSVYSGQTSVACGRELPDRAAVIP